MARERSACLALLLDVLPGMSTSPSMRLASSMTMWTLLSVLGFARIATEDASRFFFVASSGVRGWITKIQIWM
jgi:hypothetical protein